VSGRCDDFYFLLGELSSRSHLAMAFVEGLTIPALLRNNIVLFLYKIDWRWSGT
jgi:hypothetical protein